MSFVADMDILLEEEADKQRVVEENQLAEYLAIVKQKQAETQRAYEEEQAQKRAEAQLSAREGLVYDLMNLLAIKVPLDRALIVETGDFGEWHPEVLFGGVTFGKPHIHRNGWNYREREAIYVARPCTRGCGKPVWVEANAPHQLAAALETTPAHDYACLQQFDEYGDPTTDQEGNPFPPRQRFEYVPEPTPAERYTAAIKRRRDLQFERAKEKEFAIRRILANKGVTYNGESFVAGSPSAAEKLVEFDEGYAAHCAALTDAVIEEITAREVLIAADGKPGKEDEET